jgi:hypothetical protein
MPEEAKSLDGISVGALREGHKQYRDRQPKVIHGGTPYSLIGTPLRVSKTQVSKLNPHSVRITHIHLIAIL